MAIVQIAAATASPLHGKITCTSFCSTSVCPTAQVSRVVDNLVDNACKFTPPGGTVSIALRREDGMARLSVSDTGIGIPAEDLPQLFNRFHRGRNATLYTGSGLGLAIVKAILQPQGGKVTAENTNPGTRFTVEWPSRT